MAPGLWIMVSAFEVSRTTDFLQDLVRLRRMALSSFNDRGLMMRWDPWGSNHTLIV
ncbi:MAG: hypothetical protein FRX48_01683 [Lasallia pustulata]|uniref:Uncharacterized protein n=1 Tax=Lasallia pustulata TaxID=136370 RepID=A0A5M8Q0R7_9LECA|nr:MAG: hypothetical protein FRX48_01683 [Lasallia pustulata]